MTHSVKRRRQALHQTQHHYYLNISVEAAKLSNWRIKSNRKNRFGSENRIESNGNFFCPNWNALVSVKRLAVKTASEMTYIVSSGALNSTPTNSNQPSRQLITLIIRQSSNMSLMSGVVRGSICGS